MSEPAFEALIGALLRKTEEEGRLRIPEAEAIRLRLSYRGLEDGIELIEAVKKLSVLRMLKKRSFAEIGYAIGKKNIPLSLDEVLKELLRKPCRDRKGFYPKLISDIMSSESRPYREIGSARKVTREGKVLTVFRVVVGPGRDGRIRAQIQARRTALPTTATVSTAGDGSVLVMAPGIRFRITANAGQYAQTLAQWLSRALQAGVLQVDIEGPSVAKVLGSPLAELAEAIHSAHAIVETANFGLPSVPPSAPVAGQTPQPTPQPPSVPATGQAPAPQVPPSASATGQATQPPSVPEAEEEEL